MMKSESEMALSGDQDETVPPFLGAYGAVGTPFRSRRYSRPYQRIDQQERSDMPVGLGGHGWGFFLRRALIGVAVITFFIAGVSTANTRRLSATDWVHQQQSQQQRTPDSHPGILQETLAGAAAGTSAAAGAAGVVPPDPSATRRLTLVATNEYGTFDRQAAIMYELNMLIEPFRETKIAVVQSGRQHSGRSPSAPARYDWFLAQADASGRPLENTEPEVDSRGGSFSTVTLKQAGATYALVVRQLGGSDGKTVVAEGRTTITCKYVRRELRDLTQRDREAFFEAMLLFYTVPLDDGRRKYGEMWSNAQLVSAYHNSKNFCFHNGMHFLNAHAAFDLWVERSLQLIDPTVSLPMWDFMRDTASLGQDWPDSDIFGTDMFGSAIGTLNDGHEISDGWFAGIKRAYDPHNTLVDEGIDTNHNVYGYVDAGYNFQDGAGVVRTHSFCGMRGAAEFASCQTFVGCFDKSDSLSNWATCMETEVHASMHGMLGGGINCNVDMVAFQEEHPQFHVGLLTYSLEYLLGNKWPGNKLMYDHNVCSEECSIGQQDDCGCTCTMDPFELSDDEVYSFMEDFMTTLLGRLHGEKYVAEDPSMENSIYFMQNGDRLDERSQYLLLRTLMVIGCEPGSVGQMSTGASPMDPIFWVLHPAFEKATHILYLSPRYRDTYDFSWVDADCDTSSGGLENDTYPFTEQGLGMGESSELLTNAQITALLHPSNSKVPYLYDHFGEWGDCTHWNPCEDCAVSSSDWR